MTFLVLLMDFGEFQVGKLIIFFTKVPKKGLITRGGVKANVKIVKMKYKMKASLTRISIIGYLPKFLLTLPSQFPSRGAIECSPVVMKRGNKSIQAIQRRARAQTSQPEIDPDILTHAADLLLAVNVEGPMVLLVLAGQARAVLRNKTCWLRGQSPGNRAEIFVLICPLVAPDSLRALVSESQPGLTQAIPLHGIVKLTKVFTFIFLKRKFSHHNIVLSNISHRHRATKSFTFFHAFRNLRSFRERSQFILQCSEK